MRFGKWIAILMIGCILQMIPVQAIGEGGAEKGTAAEQGGFNLNDVQITISGVPIEDVLGAASGMFADVVEENVSEAVDGLNGIFGELADGLNEGLGEIDSMVGSMIEDTWYLKIPDVLIDAGIKRSPHDNALELYHAQNDGTTTKAPRIAMDTAEGCGNNIIYIYDEAAAIPAILAAVENGTFGENEIIFGLEGNYGTYVVSAILFLSPSDEPYAMCNMTDLADEERFNAYRDYINEHAAKNYDEPIEYGDQLLTIVLWNQDENADWLTVVAKEIPTKIE